MENTPQIIPDGYAIQHLESKFLFYTSLQSPSQSCHFIYFTKSLLVSRKLYIAFCNFRSKSRWQLRKFNWFNVYSNFKLKVFKAVRSFCPVIFHQMERLLQVVDLGSRWINNAINFPIQFVYPHVVQCTDPYIVV